jgi:mRNA-degrading endonuclease toxin of MazEF toxin-antitoxin module
LIISDQTVHQTGDVLVVQITSQFYSDALAEQIHTSDLTYSLPKQSYIRCHKIFVVEQTLIIGKISALNPSKYQ